MLDSITIPNGRSDSAKRGRGRGFWERTGTIFELRPKEVLIPSSLQYYGETLDEQVETIEEIVDTNGKKRNPEYRVEMGNDVFKVDESSPCASPRNHERDTYATVSEIDEDAIIANADPSR